MMYLQQKIQEAPRGFTLLIAIILTSIILSVGIALTDISYKQIELAATARQSQYAFYNADSALECALYYDSIDQFDYTNEPVGSNPTISSGQLSCEGQTFNYYGAADTGNGRSTTWIVPCAGDNTTGDGSASVTVVKKSSGQTGFYANGFNVCTALSSTRVERGEEAQY